MLLYEVMRHPLDPGYEMAARQGAPVRRSPSRAAVTLVLAVLVAFCTVVAVRDLRRPEPEALRLRHSLEGQIERRTAVVKGRHEANAALHQAIAVLQDSELTRGGAADLAARVQEMSVFAGDVAVRGPGLELTLQDADLGDEAVGSDPRENAESVPGKVMDRDLQVVVNGMWLAGAEAVSVNGQRLTTLSAIRSAGQAILVDYRPLVPPYVIRAVGDPSTMRAGFAADMAGSYVQTLRDNYGIASTMDVRENMTIPGTGDFSLRWARSADMTVQGFPVGRPEASTTGTVVERSVSPANSPTDAEVSP